MHFTDLTVILLRLKRPKLHDTGRDLCIYIAHCCVLVFFRITESPILYREGRRWDNDHEAFSLLNRDVLLRFASTRRFGLVV
jgi:hypothetical protein